MSAPSSLALLKNPRVGYLLLLGFSSGLPLALTSGTLQAWMTVAGMDLRAIGFFSLVGQAYVFKFLWAPLMDRYRPPLPARLGRRRSWLVLTQCGLALGITAMAATSPDQAIWTMAALAVTVAFLSASQDIVFDAYRADLLTQPERGIGVATSVLGYRLAMLASGGLALWLADRHLGWQSTYLVMAGLMLASVLVTLMAPEPVEAKHIPRSLQEAVIGPLKQFFSRHDAWAMLLLIVLYKLGDAFAGSLSTAFLIRGVGFSAGEVGLINKSMGLIATIIGALFGGLLMARLGLYRSLMLFGLLQAVSNLGYWVLAVTPAHLWSMAAAVGVENLCGGMGTAAFVALLMALCDRSFSATQYALLSALAAVGRVYVGPASGYMVEAIGWASFFLCTVAIALPGLALLWWFRDAIEAREAQSAATH